MQESIRGKIVSGILDWLRHLKDWQSAIVIAVVGFIVFAPGLSAPFQGDDYGQIVDNTAVHSLANIGDYFVGSNFYSPGTDTSLDGVYYRPLMTVVFALVYSVAGAQPLYFHLLQLLLHVCLSIIVYLFFRVSFKNLTSLVLAFLFLVHPINSQNVYAIASMQDVLFMLFGMTALLLLMKYVDKAAFVLAMVCLALSLFSKETGVLFMLLALVYIVVWGRKRVAPYVVASVMILTGWFILRSQATGNSLGVSIAPIDSLSLGERLLTAPSIIVFYLSKLVFPQHLAQSYYWVHPSFSIRDTFLPLVIVLLLIGALAAGGYYIFKTMPKPYMYGYLFFVSWMVLGMAPYTQIIPLDMTASETWFYFSMVGLLGVLGLLFERIRSITLLKVTAIFVVAAVLVLGTRTFIRGFDWQDVYALSYMNIQNSKEDYISHNVISAKLLEAGKYEEARNHAQRSVDIYPTFINYCNLGVAYAKLGMYQEAYDSYMMSLKYGDYYLTYENLSALTLVYGDKTANLRFLEDAAQKYPKSVSIWMFLALAQYGAGNTAVAKNSINQAAMYGTVPDNIYSGILQGKHIILTTDSSSDTVRIPSD